MRRDFGYFKIGDYSVSIRDVDGRLLLVGASSKEAVFTYAVEGDNWSTPCIVVSSYSVPIKDDPGRACLAAMTEAVRLFRQGSRGSYDDLDQ